MQRCKYIFLLWSCIAALTLLATQNTDVEAAARKLHPHKTPPTATSVVSTLFGIAALTPDSIWAVGTSMKIPQFTGQPLIEHWDGNTWQIIPGPATPQNELNTLIGVATVTNTDVWAAGFSMNATKSTSQALIEHWNGASWQIVPTPTTIKGGMSAITASGPNDVWAVGSSYSSAGTNPQALIEHWNGSTWQVVPSASTIGNSNLLSVTALNAHDIWAVGSFFSTQKSEALIEHWDGSTWQTMPAPASTMNFNTLSGVTVTSDHDVWAVGDSFSQPSQIHPSIDHWNGTTWSTLPTSGLPTPFTPTAISATSPNDIWICGGQTLAHWNGKSWQSFSLTAQKGVNFLSAIAALTPDHVWAVGGSTIESQILLPLIVHWNGSSWQVTLPRS